MTKRLIDSNYKVLTEEERKKEWEEVEELVLQYQKYREDTELNHLSKDASQELLIRFQNLFKKYISSSGNEPYVFVMNPNLSYILVLNSGLCFFLLNAFLRE